MNTPLLRWLLNIETIPADAENVRLAWENPWPAWAWALLIVSAGVFAAWSYSRLVGKRAGRITLAGVRCAILLLVITVIAGPMLEMPRESVEQDWVLALVDRSASMQIPDGAAVTQPVRMTRDEQLRSILDRHTPVLAELSEQRQLVWLGFHMGAFSLPGAETEAAAIPELGPADGPRTNINTAIEQALQRAAGRPLSGVVVFSDGRTSDPPTRSLLRRLQADAVPVYVVPLGSSDPLSELAIRRVDAPRRAFVRDKVPVSVQLDSLGDAAAGGRATIRLVDEMAGEELDRVEIAAGEQREAVTLTAEPRLAGRANWRIEIDTERPALVPEHTVHRFAIELIDRPLRVLFVEGYPRWEYRYVKNLMVRERSIESSVMLISADRDFAQEGNQPITRLPRSPEEFAEFDVIVLGDVPASFFTPSQLEMIRDHVAERGAGLLWIAGERDTPSSYAGTVLADLLPMRSGSSRGAQAIGRPVLMQPTELAERLGVLQLTTPGGVGWPEELTDPSYGWSRLQWAVRVEPSRLKPTAEVLAETTERFDGSRLPLVTLMRYGAGQTIFVATDEIWRWRYGRGEQLPEQFWVQMMRMLGRESLEASGQQAILEVSPRRAQVSQPIRLELRLLDARLTEDRRASVVAILENERGETTAEIELVRDGGAEERFAATYLPDIPGSYRVRLADAAIMDSGAEATIEVYAPDDEMRRPETDHALLAELADITGGKVLDPDDLDALRSLPNRSIRTSNPLTERIWDTPLFFLLILLALTAEWIGRKVLRLV
ncbi:MAG TPA: hypothetical protein PK098_07960 [Phycisphaerales bacterium]|nr:hypothetical protein [Phycisphaerales bacterium]